MIWQCYAPGPNASDNGQLRQIRRDLRQTVACDDSEQGHVERRPSQFDGAFEVVVVIPAQAVARVVHSSPLAVIVVIHVGDEVLVVCASASGCIPRRPQTISCGCALRNCISLEISSPLAGSCPDMGGPGRAPGVGAPFDVTYSTPELSLSSRT
jgi:hypothetical protein